VTELVPRDGFFRESYGNGLKDGTPIGQAAFQEEVANARPRTLPAVIGVTGSLESHISKDRL
jgi:hypothetical protein